MNTIRATFKLLGFATLLSLFLCHGYLVKLWYQDIWKIRRYMLPWMGRYSRATLKLFGFKVQIPNRTPIGQFVVSNHLSYLDILVLSAVTDTTYVTSIEMKNAPVLGWMTQVAGCLYVERRNKNNLSNEIQDISNALKKNFRVTVFPEATSTNASRVLPFKKPLFKCATENEIPIQPICINYTQIDGETFNLTNRDFICWYGDMGFLSHLWSVVHLRRVMVELTVLQPIPTHKETDLAVISAHSHSQISAQFHNLEA